MNRHIVAVAALVVLSLGAAPASAIDRDSGVGPLIAAQGNAALVAIREQARANVLAQRPALPPAEAVLAALRGGPVLPTTWRCAQ